MLFHDTLYCLFMVFSGWLVVKDVLHLDNKSINNENINYKKATYFIKNSIKSDLKQ